MKAHEKILTSLEKAFCTLPDAARAEVCERIAPALRSLNTTLGSLDRKHPELAEQLKAVIMPIIKVFAASFLGVGPSATQVVEGVIQRAPDLAPTLFLAIQDARK